MSIFNTIEIYVTLLKMQNEEEVIDFLARETKLPKEQVKEKVREILNRGKFTMSYHLRNEKFTQEKRYFLNLLKTKTPEEVAELFAEQSVMLENQIALSSFYLYQVKKRDEEIKKLKKRIKELENSLKAKKEVESV